MRDTQVSYEKYFGIKHKTIKSRLKSGKVFVVILQDISLVD